MLVMRNVCRLRQFYLSIIKPSIWYIGKYIFVLFIIYLLSPHRFAAHYSYLSSEEIPSALVAGVTENISRQNQSIECNYDDIFSENRFMYTKKYKDVVLQSDEIILGGEYYPNNCRPKFSTAIIVPYRQREEQLHAFLTYMHNYLRQQRIHYRIILIEQCDSKLFNRAKLLNIGGLIANELGFPCFVFSDVDLLPLNLGSLYACTELPRHMCSAIDIWRFNLPYRGLLGGVVAIRPIHFILINGLSNSYEGWGGEDDDFYKRLQIYGINICRFAPSFSQYTMLNHPPQLRNENRHKLLDQANLRLYIDGLDALFYIEKERRLYKLFTHILVET